LTCPATSEPINLTPLSRSECFQIIFEQLHGQGGVVRLTPPIALNATNQHLTVVIDFH